MPGGSTVGIYPLSSYAPNAEITTSWSQFNSGRPAQRLAAIGESASIVLLAENHNCCIATSGGVNWQRAAGRHSGGSNYALVDGHVKWLKGPVPRYALDSKGEPLGTPVCLDKRNRTNCPIYFRPQSG